MPELTFTNEEVETLIVLLESSLGDLSYEIADTDLSQFKDHLKARRAVLLQILDTLKASGS